jgi:hypothetical protein
MTTTTPTTTPTTTTATTTSDPTTTTTTTITVTTPLGAGERRCPWCHHRVPVECRPGRPRIYCRASCRQRAYERRAGLGVIPPAPERLVTTPGGPLAHLPSRSIGYEAGRVGFLRGRIHAMRPHGIAERPSERRLTLCGQLAMAVPRPFTSVEPNTCKTCTMIEQRRPSQRPVRPSPELAAWRTLLDHAAIQLHRHHRDPHHILTDLLQAA